MVESLRVLWLNWRDIKHPLAGGAEVYMHEVARRLVRQGFEVTLLTSRFRGAPRTEVIDGYEVVRSGGRLGVYLSARRSYLRSFRGGVDVVVDEINTVPFMTPLYVREPVVALIHQLCVECWYYHYPKPLAWVGRAVEPVLHKPYVREALRGGLAVVTVSESTRGDLESLGYPGSSIRIVRNGIDMGKYRACPKSLRPRVCYVGRVTPYKRVEDQVRAYALLKEEFKDLEWVVAGRADPVYLARLKALARELGVDPVFMVNVSHEEKVGVLCSSWVHVYTSVREGWGQTVIEAAACGTPTVAYDVPGLRDSIKYLGWGALAPSSYRGLARVVAGFVRRGPPQPPPGVAERVRGLSWDRAAEAFTQVLKEVVVGGG